MTEIRTVGELLLVTPGSKKRHEIMLANHARLTEMARKAIQANGLTPLEFVMTCIQVDDARWRGIVDALMPGYDWQQYRDRGEEPIARGSAMSSLCEYLSEEMPDMAAALLEKPKDGFVKAIVLGEQGGTVYEIPI